MGRLVGTQIGCRLVVVVAGGSLGAEYARTELNHIEIDLENAAFRQVALELPGEDDFANLSIRRPGRRQPQVLGQLLGDGRRAADPFALDRLPCRDPDLVGVEAGVVEKAQVLRDQDRFFEIDGYRIGGNPSPLDISAARTGLFDKCSCFRVGV